MGLLDDVTVIFGKGANTVDKKIQSARYQADLSKLSTDLEAAYSELGHAVLKGEGANKSFLAVYGTNVSRIKELEQQILATRKSIEELNKVDQAQSNALSASGVPTGACPSCGAMVAVDAVRCQVCGDNLAALKHLYRRCPKCGKYYDAEAVFCIDDGERTEELSVAPALSVQSDSLSVSNGSDGLSAAGANGVHVQPAMPGMRGEQTCPACGAAIHEADAFCGACGAPLR